MYFVGWRWIDLNDAPGALDWVAFLVGGIGIGFTIYQLLRSKGALKAAREALDDTRSTLMQNQLVAMLPKLAFLLDSIESTIRSEDRELLRINLERYMQDSIEISQLTESLSLVETEVANDLQLAALEAETMRSLLYDNRGSKLVDLMHTHLSKLRSTGLKVHRLSIQLRNDTSILSENRSDK